MEINLKLLSAIASKSNAEKFLQPIIDTCRKYNINTPSRALCFLSQVGHESGGLFYTEELASGRAYEGRADLGNVKVGDGEKYKGRGVIQITGRANYTSLSKDLGIDFISDPTLLGGKNVTKCTDSQLRNAALSAGWFWNKNRLNDYADKVNVAKTIEKDPNLQAFKDLTKRINGGYNGLQDRVSKFKALQAALK